MAVSVNVHCTRHSLWFCFFQAKCHIAGLGTFCRAMRGPRAGCLSRCISSQECKSSSIRGFQPQVRYARRPESQGREGWGSTVFLSRRTRGYNGCSEVWAQCPWQSAYLLWAPQTVFLKIKSWRLQVPALPSSPQAASLPPGCWGLPPTSQH